MANRTTHYCDYAATSPLRPEALDAMTAALVEGGNPSSIHAFGRRARARVEQARETLATAVGAALSEVAFTSGGTEACNAMILGTVAALRARGGPDPVLFVSPLEHDAVGAAAAATGLRVEPLPVLPAGVVDDARLQERLSAWDPARDGTPLVALMLANNETGAIQPVRAVADAAHAAGGFIAVDAVQALARIEVHMGVLGADYLAISGHKVGGPSGVGALVVREGSPFEARQIGGGQERGLRSGTENVVGIVGFAAALRAALRDLPRQRDLAASRTAFEARLKRLGDAIIVAEDTPRLPHISCFGHPGLSAATLVMALDLQGVMVSAGAACSSGKMRPSRVLAAMGVEPALAASAIRASFGWATTDNDFQALEAGWLAQRDRVLRPASAA